MRIASAFCARAGKVTKGALCKVRCILHKHWTLYCSSRKIVIGLQQLRYTMGVILLMLILSSLQNPLGQSCSLPAITEYDDLIEDTYDSAVVELFRTKFLCISGDGDTATLAVQYTCEGRQCECTLVIALIDLQRSNDVWKVSGRKVVQSTCIFTIREGNNCYRCINATEREKTYPDDDRTTYFEDNHCLGKVNQYLVSFIYVHPVVLCYYKS